MTLDRIQLWSCGGGRQSAGIAALMVEGRLRRPDAACMVAIEWEVKTTWKYLNAYIRPAMESMGVPLTLIPRKKYATKKFFGGAEGVSPLLPMYTNQSGSPAKLNEWCSGEWKRDVAARWSAEQGDWKERGVDNWIGISWDERDRRRSPRRQWIKPVYPLLDWFPKAMGVSACLAAVERVGWPEPPRSRCHHCPNQSDDEWAELTPEEWSLACDTEDEIRARFLSRVDGAVAGREIEADWPNEPLHGRVFRRDVFLMCEVSRAVAEWLPLFFRPSDVLECRFLDVAQRGRTHAGWLYARDIPKCANTIAAVAKVAGGAYFTPQVLKNELLRRGKPGHFPAIGKESRSRPTADDDVAARRYLILDIDPTRPADVCATDAEKEAAGIVARKLRELIGRLLPAPLVVDSGNGFHLYYRLHEPVDGTFGATNTVHLNESLGWRPLSGDPIANLLAILGRRADTPAASVDRRVYNPSRIMKIPGTFAKKGEDTPERPYRQSKVIEVPNDWSV